MRTRMIVALALLPLLLVVVLVFPVWATAVLIAAMSVIAVHELLVVTGLVKNTPLFVAAMVMAPLVTFYSYFDCPHEWGLVILLLYVATLFGIFLYYHAQLSFQKVCISAFAGILIPFLLSALVRILILPYGRFYVLVAFILAFAADSGAYFVGRAFGRRKLAPIVSPQKTMEGAIGGVVFAVFILLLYGLILQTCFDFRVRYGLCVLYGVLGSLASILGDLALSVVKRQTGIKDYGRILPGHGGILDRFDSMLIVAPLTEALVLLLPLIAK